MLFYSVCQGKINNYQLIAISHNSKAIILLFQREVLKMYLSKKQFLFNKPI